MCLRLEGDCLSSEYIILVFQSLVWSAQLHLFLYRRMSPVCPLSRLIQMIPRLIITSVVTDGKSRHLFNQLYILRSIKRLNFLCLSFVLQFLNDVNCFCNIVSSVTDQCFLKKPVVTPDSGVRGHDGCTAMPVQHIQAFFVFTGLTNSEPS